MTVVHMIFSFFVTNFVNNDNSYTTDEAELETRNNDIPASSHTG